MGGTLHEIRGKIGKWFWLRVQKKQSYVDSELNPVLLVPGIAGSILMAVDENGHKERIWVRVIEAEREFQKKLWSVFDPKTGKTMSLDPKTRIEVPEDRFGLYSCDILDPDLIVHMKAVCYFHGMIKEMVTLGYKEGTTLFGFGYDFRQSNRLQETMDRFTEKLESIHKASGGKKVDIISHSMGGLLVKCFVALNNEVFEKYVNKWVAIAAPFQGAPGLIMDGLLRGIAFVEGWKEDYISVSKWSMHQLMVECPSIYELLPCPKFQWSSLPLLQIWREIKNDEFGHSSVELDTYGPHNCASIMQHALVNNSITYDGMRIPLPFNCEILKWAHETRRIMSLAKIPPSVKFYNIYGTGKDTPFSVTYGSEQKPISSMEQLLHWEAVYSCVEGDGAVPVESAMADGLAAEERIGIPGDHRGLICEESVFRILKHWLKDEDSDLFYDPVDDFIFFPTEDELEDEDSDLFYDPVDDFIIFPTKDELEENRRESLSLQSTENCETHTDDYHETEHDFLASGVIQSAGSVHAALNVHLHPDSAGDSEEKQRKASTINRKRFERKIISLWKAMTGVLMRTVYPN